MGDPVLELRQVSKLYRTGGHPFVAVRQVDLAVAAGEIVGIGGPSGAGKSTLLRMLAAIEPPDRGEVWLAGEAAWRRVGGGLRRRVPRPGYVMAVFQDPPGSLDPYWPVWRSVTEPLIALGPRLSRHDRRNLARDWLARVGLAQVDPRAMPAQLSVGQCQRVALARALIAQPAAIVADEPTSALDVTSGAGIIRLLREAAMGGTAIVVVSHDQRMLDVLADRVTRLVDGRLTDPRS
ncbi:ATP-binding cassette domain-containing protein [Natronosporangium hydrolyticum]|uniref:ATP-binding cassette domain-containing protein n=1 Tax=Natronosporangium hydrolyticum TaxID=2811111 RepID=A0A895YS23_9ACTN|nr:ATP-binding cassette domain-containing protein [Natronosporangium hydrolyticum]QSB16818.1 ATP-binding cassette domain-containing protein [Natronosporangium hydrolyticum]